MCSLDCFLSVGACPCPSLPSTDVLAVPGGRVLVVVSSLPGSVTSPAVFPEICTPLHCFVPCCFFSPSLFLNTLPFSDHEYLLFRRFPKNTIGSSFIILGGTFLFVSLMQRPVRGQYMTQPRVEDGCMCLLLLCISQAEGLCKTPPPPGCSQEK